MTHPKNRSSRFCCCLLVVVVPSERGLDQSANLPFCFRSLEPTRSASLVQPNRC
ncbi:hypothetical protein CTAM01_02234 [Colletotrichum tamarilloi]|uniref:Secreted protein n=1 Tax=Colletotrichum tamarilloi TaxID=1209934 RepID=A0ABQ9RN99_9PEZI|nr:uncharacterized protein CTAM01_02234 [Colletotrichum tamarilloi]KAK1508448.1 hypothetical protein CTAM01_02234 [Colletotrichum tamarilloi]